MRKVPLVLIAVVCFSVFLAPTVVMGQSADSSPTSPVTDGPAVVNVSEGSPTNTTIPPINKSTSPKIADELRPTSPNDGLTTQTTAPQNQSVVIEFSTSPNASDLHEIRAYGQITAQHGQLVQATLPSAALATVAEKPTVQFIRRPHYLESSEITTEGLETINGTGPHGMGYTGENVTVAVIDTGFNLSDPEIADHVVRSKDFTGKGIGYAPFHGTATTQIVADVAPNASIVAVSVETEVQLLNATDWVTNNTSADVVSMSLGINGGVPLDGTSIYDQAISTSTTNGVTWFVSAGNEGGGKHWNGTWQDTDGDNIMEFGPDGDETLGITAPLKVTLQWHDWNGSANDYDVFLLNNASTAVDDLDYDYSTLRENAVAGSANLQNGSQAPVESFSYQESGSYELVIYRFDASGEADFDVFMSSSGSPEYWTATRSITPPATGHDVAAVGAIDYNTEQLEPYSSQGPTIDGRLKPEFVAPDRVTTSVYDPFPGTSAAAPHVAGAAAVVLDANTSLSPPSLVSTLQTTAATRTWGTPNNRVGSGLIDLERAVQSVMPSLNVSTNVSDAVEAGQTTTVEVVVTDAETHTTVEGALVNITGAGVSVAERTTNTSGKAVFSLKPTRTGNLTTTATKQGMKRAQTTIPVQKATVPLNLTAANQTIVPGSAVTFSLEERDSPANGTIIVNGTEYTTGSDGHVNVSFPNLGAFTAIGYLEDTNTTDYVNATVEISVVEPAAIEVSYGVDSETVGVGQPVAVTATINNSGGLSDSFTVAFRADGAEFTTETVEVDGETSIQLTNTVEFNETGMHNVTVNELNTTKVTVEETSGWVYDLGSAAAVYDDNADGLIQLGELGTAAEDYAQGEINLGALGNVAEAYAQS